MFSSFFKKVGTFADHHQLLIGGIIFVSIVLVTWGIEKILEAYIFPRQRERDSIIAVTIGLALLWLIKHFTLKEW